MSIRREAAWLVASFIGAFAFCWYAPEYGYSPVLFFTLVFYAIAGVVRFVVYVVK
jgi:hypothetical protein